MRQAVGLVVLGVALVSAVVVGHCPSVSGEQASTQTVATSSLEGTTWPVKVTPDATAAQKGEKPFDDELAFKNGHVAMSACVKAGFAPSGYTLAPSGSSWSFKTRQVSKDQGNTKWTGLVSGDAIKGTMIWTKTDGTILHYNYEGKKVAAASKS